MSRIKRWLNLNQKKVNKDGDLKEEYIQQLRSYGFDDDYITEHAGVTDKKILKKVALSSFYDFVRQWNYIQQELNLELPLPKDLMSIESVDNVGAANSASVTVAQQEINEIVESINSKAATDNQVPSIEEFDGDNAFWDDDQDVQLELSDEQKAARVEIDALFG